MDKMPPELELLICSARPKSPDTDRRICELLESGLDWNDVLACALEHKLAGVLYDWLCTLLGFSLAPQPHEKLIGIVREQTKYNLVFLTEMLWLCGIFETAGIPAVPFKGPALAWLAYANFAQRACVDLDFVLPQRYILQATELLRSNGYAPQFGAAEAQAGVRGPAPGQYAFSPGDRHASLELHTERTLRYFSRPLNLEEMNSRAIHFEIGGQDVRTFRVEDLLVMLCVHGAKHFWERLSWVVDIAQLVTNRDVNWEVLAGVAAEMQSTRLLLLGLYLAHDLVEAPLPPSVLERASADRQIRWMAAKVTGQYAANSPASIGVLPRALFRYRSSDGPWQGVCRLFRLGLTPTETDREKIHLPAVLSPLYALVRPMRLLEKYGIGLRRPAKADHPDHELPRAAEADPKKLPAAEEAVQESRRN